MVMGFVVAGAGFVLLLEYFALLPVQIEDVLGRAVLDADFPGGCPYCPLLFIYEVNQFSPFLQSNSGYIVRNVVVIFLVGWRCALFRHQIIKQQHNITIINIQISLIFRHPPPNYITFTYFTLVFIYLLDVVILTFHEYRPPTSIESASHSGFVLIQNYQILQSNLNTFLMLENKIELFSQTGQKIISHQYLPISTLLLKFIQFQVRILILLMLKKNRKKQNVLNFNAHSQSNLSHRIIKQLQEETLTNFMKNHWRQNNENLGPWSRSEKNTLTPQFEASVRNQERETVVVQEFLSALPLKKERGIMAIANKKSLSIKNEKIVKCVINVPMLIMPEVELLKKQKLTVRLRKLAQISKKTEELPKIEIRSRSRSLVDLLQRRKRKERERQNYNDQMNAGRIEPNEMQAMLSCKYRLNI